MRKQNKGRKLGRGKSQRKALLKSLVSSLFLHERIKTTEDKAKAIKADVDKIITIAKKGEVKARNLLQSKLPKREVEKVILEIAPRFNGRQGGYTRNIRIGRRFSDNAQMVLMEWTEQNQIKNEKFPPKADQPLAEKIKNGEDGKTANAKAQKRLKTQKE